MTYFERCRVFQWVKLGKLMIYCTRSIKKNSSISWSKKPCFRRVFLFLVLGTGCVNTIFRKVKRNCGWDVYWMQVRKTSMTTTTTTMLSFSFSLRMFLSTIFKWNEMRFYLKLCVYEFKIVLENHILCTRKWYKICENGMERMVVRFNLLFSFQLNPYI